MTSDADVYGLGEFEAGTLSFDAWLALVDAEVVRITSLQGGVGFGHDDFNDWGYADAFADELEPVQVARDMLAEDVTGKQYLDAAGIKGGW